MNEIPSLLEKNLKHHLELLKPTHELFHEVMKYAVLPAGKLFRPLLCASSFADKKGLDQTIEELSNPMSDLSLCCSALEIHHAYTLVHDDLPCMDDDDMRRGRPSTHKKYGQWQAVLAGDALLHHSHTLLSKIRNKEIRKALGFFNWALGAKGLILGQVYDLGGEIHESFENLLVTHVNKTARLIQTSLYLGSWAAQPEIGYKETIKIMRFGEALGVSFQLLDDLSEATEKLSEHELKVNPFINFQDLAYTRLEKDLTKIHTALQEGSQKNSKGERVFLAKTLENYFLKMKKMIEADLEKPDSLIENYFGTKKDWKALTRHLG